MKFAACSAMPFTEVGVAPVERPIPALSKMMTDRSLAKPLITAGSQSSVVPRNRWQNTMGVPVAAPIRRNAKRMPFASTNCVTADSCVVSVFMGFPFRVEGAASHPKQTSQASKSIRSVNSDLSSPDWNISRTISAPPTNSPFT
jgi:hypothetical protein